jgi:hypothetical protein
MVMAKDIVTYLFVMVKHGKSILQIFDMNFHLPYDRFMNLLHEFLYDI